MSGYISKIYALTVSIKEETASTEGSGREQKTPYQEWAQRWAHIQAHLLQRDDDAGRTQEKSYLLCPFAFVNGKNESCINIPVHIK